MDLSSRRQLVETLIPIIRQAGKAALKLQKDDLAARTKEDGSPVTAADLASHRILRAACLASFPAIPVISEEDTPTAGADTNAAILLIDPLDGTKELIKGSDEFAVNIALVEDGRVGAGLIYAPARDRLFFSWGAGLAFEQTAAGLRRKLPYHLAPRAQPIALVSRSHCDPRTEALLAALKPCDVQEMGSSLKFAFVAAAEADFYLRLGPTMIWDCAAGQAIIEAAGGTVLRADGSSLAYRFNRTRKVDGFIAARTPELAAHVVTAMKALQTGNGVAESG
ncbi:3'(2'),5'-bisphosphate nucleotidase CysQ family protein [Rhizobium mesosinicum]|uniref:3'(2'),5'-bisphosphate nucleotidase CysQ n=1 Tax=Rhizobium mesosinicum TaxID=335017 RepID=A0ABS7GR25_9HYPH|nr:3'(2'),5'-bisphosphate nucleotidase CysQ [Rhizobium mesosinicum]MBW9052354.1 3'(2'),5'-bisphosphate nucleotidase CysQ [Rhizobium mesosinicum]